MISSYFARTNSAAVWFITIMQSSWCWHDLIHQRLWGAPSYCRSSDEEWFCCCDWRSRGHRQSTTEPSRKSSRSRVELCTETKHTTEVLFWWAVAWRCRGHVSLSALCETTRVYWYKQLQAVRGGRWHRAVRLRRGEMWWRVQQSPPPVFWSFVKINFHWGLITEAWLQWNNISL